MTEDDLKEFLEENKESIKAADIKPTTKSDVERDNPNSGNRYDNSAAVVIPDFERAKAPLTTIVDTTCAVMEKAGARIDQLIERVDELSAENGDLRDVIREMIAAHDAMAAFVIACDPAKVGEAQWDAMHKERAERRRRADEAGRAAIKLAPAL